MKRFIAIMLICLNTMFLIACGTKYRMATPEESQRELPYPIDMEISGKRHHVTDFNQFCSLIRKNVPYVIDVFVAEKYVTEYYYHEKMKRLFTRMRCYELKDEGMVQKENSSEKEYRLHYILPSHLVQEAKAGKNKTAWVDSLNIATSIGLMTWGIIEASK